jgi:hypothetical protein
MAVELITYLREYFMGTMPERSATCELLVGVLLAEAGIVLLGFGEWDPKDTGAWMPFYAAGFLSLAVGMSLIWKEPLSALMIADETPPDGAAGKPKVRLLGRIDLNGYYLEAYEEEADHLGRRFRLRSFPPIGPESEAGFIRYLIREGFIEKRWPRLSALILEEAGWAFKL